jgi:hypothetical protein
MTETDILIFSRKSGRDLNAFKWVLKGLKRFKMAEFGGISLKINLMQKE